MSRVQSPRHPIEECLNYTFTNKDLIEQALTHASFAHEHHNTPSNQRLEFLGDAVLDLIVADILYAYGLDEGEMTQRRARWVNGPALAELATTLNLFEYMYLGKGQKQEGPTPKLLADVLEALVAAVFIDGGYTAAFQCFAPWFRENLYLRSDIDPKTALQEVAQSKGLGTPSYRSKHQPDGRIQTQVILGSKLVTTAAGSTKRQAEQNAAKKALTRIESEAMKDSKCKTMSI